MAKLAGKLVKIIVINTYNVDAVTKLIINPKQSLIVN